MNKTAILALACFLCWQSVGQAKDKTLLLVSVHESNGAVSFWWRCDSQPLPEVTDRMAGMLTAPNNTVVHSCKQLETPLHRSYHRVQLRSYQQFNLANTAGASRLITGQLRYKEHAAIADLGLFHHAATLTLTSYDVGTERSLATASLGGHGFGHTVVATRKQVDNAILSQLGHRFNELLAKPALRLTPQLRIRVDGLPTPGQLTPIMDRVRAVAGVRNVFIDQLRQGAAVLRIQPKTVRAAVEEKLLELAPDCAVTILP